MNRYYHHVLACNQWNPQRFIPFMVAEKRVGWLRHDHVGLLIPFQSIFDICDRSVTLVDNLATKEARTAAIDHVGRTLAAQGSVPPYRGEAFAAAPEWGDEILFDVDRGLVPFFGVKGYGVHLNGYCTSQTGIDMWVGHRSATKKVDPLKLDNVVAGGIAAGYGIAETLLKEGAEEAAMTPELLAAAQPAGSIHYRLEVAEGMRDDILFLYDLELSQDFEPRNTDGEFDSFERMPIARCLDLIAGTDQFKFNVTLTLIDFAIRRGLIGPDHPEYALLVSGLRGGLIPEIEIPKN